MTPAAITIAVPLPPKQLTPNARVHWRAKMGITRKYRSAANSASIEAIRTQICARHETPHSRRPLWKQATSQATFYFKVNRKRDRDNLLASLKAAFDGLADAGVVDNDAALTHLPVAVAIDKARPRVEIVITKVGAGEGAGEA